MRHADLYSWSFWLDKQRGSGIVLPCTFITSRQRAFSNEKFQTWFALFGGRFRAIEALFLVKQGFRYAG